MGSPEHLSPHHHGDRQGSDRGRSERQDGAAEPGLDTEPAFLGPYRLLSTLGSGGFGEVHLALDPEGRTVAVKMLHPHIASDAHAIARLAREVETMRRVRGRHVAEVLGASLTGPRPYIVTRYVQGRALSVVLAAGGPIQGDDLVRLACGLADALECVHAAGVVHRDLKPANIIIADGEPYLIDFGIACALESASVTASGAVVGTPGYVAPEVLEGWAAGPEADVFAWAATVAFAATGRQPYGTGPVTAVAYRVVHHEPDLSGVPSWLAPLLAECLDRDPRARPTAAGLVARLASAAPDVSSPARATLPPVAPAIDGPAAGLAGARGSAPTREWRPGERRPEERSDAGHLDARARHRRKLHRRWVIGSALVVGLFAAAAAHDLPEISLLLLVLYGIGVLIDAAFGLAARARARLVVDAAGGVGVVAVYALLSSLFSTMTLLFAVATVLFLLITLVVAS
ncbi:serine/threonine-protein kinase [Sphaerimonospora sp. CA-214678]|uniref:serine/threonine-protein kinase n=1 Tax=Sphaerimonospora sp. CA-214678 TaxID=3240029 RepID=UPI003D939582